MEFIKENNDYKLKYDKFECKIDINVRIQKVEIDEESYNIYKYRNSLIIMPFYSNYEHNYFIIPDYEISNKMIHIYINFSEFQSTYHEQKLFCIKNNIIYFTYTFGTIYEPLYEHTDLYLIDLNTINTNNFKISNYCDNPIYTFDEKYKIIDGGYFEGNVYFMLCENNNYVFLNEKTKEIYNQEAFIDLIRTFRPSYVHGDNDEFDNIFEFTHKSSINKLNQYNYDTFHTKYKNIVKVMFLIKCRYRSEYKMIIPKPILFMICDMTL